MSTSALPLTSRVTRLCLPIQFHMPDKSRYRTSSGLVLQMSDKRCRFKRSMQHHLSCGSDNTSHGEPIGLAVLD